MGKKVSVLLWFSLCLFTQAFAQFYSAGSDPARLKWKQIDTEHYRVIYPVGVDSLALRYARLLQTAGMRTIEGLDTDMRKQLPVILHPYSTRCNGFVAWAPRRMELYCLPSPEAEPQNWELSLSLHESRHVGQMQWAGKGVFSTLYALLGEQSQGLAAGLFDLFSVGLLEGDAVMTETAYSAAGRGRRAEFLMPYKAYFMDSVHFSIDKWHFGSNKHFIPNEYALGYLKLTAAASLHPSFDLASVYSGITRNPFAYNKYYKQQLGANFYNWFRSASSFYTQLWQEEAVEQMPYDSLRLIGKAERHYVQYSSTFLCDNSLMALKNSLSEPLSLVRIKPDGKATRIRFMGDVNSSLEAHENLIYWTEQVNNPRWEHESFSVLMCYNIKTGKTKKLSDKTRYYHPSPSTDGKFLALAEYLVGGGSVLHILDANSAEIRQSFTVPRGAQLLEMEWDESDSRVFAILLEERGLGIFELNIAQAAWREMLAAQHFKISNLSYKPDFLTFESDISGTDNVFRYCLQTGRCFRLTHARFGAFEHCWNSSEDSLYYVHYDTQGYRPAVLGLDELHCLEQSFRRILPGEDALPKQHNSRIIDLADRLTSEVGFVADTMVLDQALTYTSRKYNKAAHLFKIHSWAPFYYDLDELSALSYDKLHRVISPGLLFMSQNDLSTSVLKAGYAYRRGFHTGHLQYTYSGWYPVLSIKADLNDRYVTRQGLVTSNQGSQFSMRDTLDQVAIDTKLSLYLPLNFSRHAWQRGLIPSFSWHFSNNQYFNDSPDLSRYLQALQAGIQLYSVMSTAPRDLFPRWGAGLNMQILAAPFNENYFTDLMYARIYAYMPGPIRNQGIKLSAMYQRHNTKNRSFYLGNAIKIRGLDNVNAPEMLAFTFDYALPVFTDLSLPRLLYLKSIEFYPFVDMLNTYTQLSAGVEHNVHISTGLESLFNLNLLRLNAAFNIGLRCSYHRHRGMVYEMLFSLPYLN